MKLYIFTVADVVKFFLTMYVLALITTVRFYCWLRGFPEKVSNSGYVWHSHQM